MKSVSYVTQLSYVQPIINVKHVASNLPVGVRLQNYWQNWLDLGAGPKVVQILKDGYALAFQIQPNLTRCPTVISCYVNPHKNSYLLEALHQLIDKNAVELVHNQTSLGFFTRLFLVPKPNNKWRHILDMGKLNLLIKVEKFKMETPETIRTSLQQGDYFHITNTATVQEISQISCTRSDIPIQSTALWSVHSTSGVHCSRKGSEAYGHTQGKKDPPVPRRLVGESQVPPSLSPAYTDSSRNVSEIGLAGELRNIRIGTKTGFQLCRLPIRPQVLSGPTHTRPVIEPSRTIGDYQNH